MALRNGVSRRDVVLVIVGAALMHIYSISFFHSSGAINTHSHDSQDALIPIAIHDTIRITRTVTETSVSTSTFTTTLPAETPQKPELPLIDLASELPQTSIVYHAPGWTLFRNLYMANGTFFILTDNNKSFPEIRMMISTSLFAENEPGNIAAREPTIYTMDYITPLQARTRWGNDTAKGYRNRVTTVEGNTVGHLLISGSI